MDVDDYRGLYLKASRSVMTVAFDISIDSIMVTKYSTGFIHVDEENYCLVLTTFKPYVGEEVVNNYFVYFA